MNKNNNKNHTKIITVTSGKGGVGKSSISINLALILHQLKKRILLLDADIHLGNIDLMLGIQPKYSILDLVKNDLDIEKVIIKAPGGIDILPASSAAPEFIGMENSILFHLAKSLNSYAGKYDIILVDTGPGISQTVTSFITDVDQILLIVTPHPASIADSYSIIKFIKYSNKSIPIIMITNMMNSPEEGDALYQKINLMVKKFLYSTIEYAGSILKDDLIEESVKSQYPFVLQYPHSSSAQALRLIYKKMLKIPVQERDSCNYLFERIAAKQT